LRNFTRLGISARLDEAMSAIQITKLPMSVSAAKATDWFSFTWSIYRRRTPFGNEADRGWLASFHAPVRMFWNELVENILKEEEGIAWSASHRPLHRIVRRISQLT